MGDGWIDNRQRTLMNFLVYCPEGISFVKSVDASDIVKDARRLISQKHKHINWSPCATHCLNLIFKDIGKMNHVAELPIVIGGVMDVIDQKVLKGKLETMNEMKLFRERLGSFGRDIAYSSREVLQPDEWWRLHRYSAPHLQKFYNKKRIYDPIDYACIDETDFWIVDDDQPVELDVEELENLLYEEMSIPINEVEDDEDGGDVAIERLDVENFGFPDAHFQSPDSNFQNE
ncbi:hypothetical protein CK203_101950 [Vitis vinifera]|uniref:DUF659 domain-containing protein n=1 Tax=Vitis vinifera TaxID=29760 RepID=A0A438BYA3_VITVI|nr:hypothetical protein CK203_101950 [Vitis vinifera]